MFTACCRKWCPCSRVVLDKLVPFLTTVFTGRIHWPWTRPVDTGSVCRRAIVSPVQMSVAWRSEVKGQHEVCYHYVNLSHIGAWVVTCNAMRTYLADGWANVMLYRRFPDNHFPGQTFPGQVILRNFHVHSVCKYKLYRPSHTERLLMYACMGLFGKACRPTTGKA